MVILHGASGFFDELVITVVAFAVMWVAIRLAGRKPADQEDELLEPVDADESSPAAEGRR